MARRIILSTAFLLVTLGASADEPKLGPFVSAKASDVMPVLDQISTQESPQVVLEKVQKILGRPFGGMGGGPVGYRHMSWYYILDDKTEVRILLIKDKFKMISLALPGQQAKIIYQSPDK